MQYLFSYFLLNFILQVLAYCAMGRIQDALPILTSVLTYDVPNAVKQIFPQDVVIIFTFFYYINADTYVSTVIIERLLFIPFSKSTYQLLYIDISFFLV